MNQIGKTQIEGSEVLWRYFKIDRFIETIEKSSIYFASARQFEDRFEGAVAVLPPDFQPDPRYAQQDHLDKAFEELKRLTKISCWHRSSYESDAMWKLYASQHKGVAICTTPDRIRSAAKPFRLAPSYGIEELYAGNVEYVDLLTVRMKPSTLERFFNKHIAFSWEKEFRIVVSVGMAEEFGVHVPELGIEVAFDLDKLVQKIVLGPSLTIEEIERVIAAATVHGLAARIEKSSLLGAPRYY